MDLGRIITAMISPMAKDGSLDYQGAQTLAEHLLDHGSDSLVVTGTTGESPTLSFAEKLKMYSAVHEVCAARRKMLIAGTSGNNTAEAVELSKKAESLFLLWFRLITNLLRKDYISILMLSHMRYPCL